MASFTQDELKLAIKVIDLHITIRKKAVEDYSSIPGPGFDPDFVEHIESEINDLYNVHDMVASGVRRML